MGADDNQRMNDDFASTGRVALSHLGVVRARGVDARSFLQGQLTNDVLTLRAGEARLAGFCSAKGRLQASFIAWQGEAEDELLLACSATLLAPTLKRLSMFVMRARCRLTDATGEIALHGRIGRADGEDNVMPVWQSRTDEEGSCIRLPDAAGRRRFIVASARSDPAAPAPSTEAAPSALTLDLWRWLDVQSGIPTIEAATVDRFVPQMINFELLGAVDFQKGCYPGQEVVARSQYRGTIKRRAFLFDCNGAASAGQEVFHDDDASQPAGLVVNAAESPHGGSSALVETKLAALESGTLRLGGPEGPVLRRAPLSYAVEPA